MREEADMMTRLKRWAVTGVCMAAGALFLGSAARGAAEDLGAYGLEGLPIPKDAVKFVDGIRCGDPNDPLEPFGARTVRLRPKAD